MADESSGHPYAAALAELRVQRDKIDAAIAAMEALMAGAPAGAGGSTPVVTAEGPSAFLGMSIPEAAKKLLATRRQPMKNPDIAAAFKAGGLHLNSKDPVNTIGAVLSRRADDIGDIVKVGRGTFGLKEWYPGRSFKRDKGEKPENGPKEGAQSAPVLSARERIHAKIEKEKAEKAKAEKAKAASSGSGQP
jgi:HB1, ASXL, restriction endonuclease HTH domain